MPEYDEKSLDAIWNGEDLADTEMRLAMLKLPIKGTGNPYLLTHLLVRIGRAQALQDKFEPAVETLNECDFVLLEAAKRDPHEHTQKHRAWIRYMIERGRVFGIVGWPDSAVNFLEDALQMARDLNQFDLFKECLETFKSLGLAVPTHPAGEPASSP